MWLTRLKAQKEHPIEVFQKMRIMLLAGPPFGPRFWDGVIARLEKHGHQAVSLNPFKNVGMFEDVVTEISKELMDTDVLVAHGSAVPAALAVAADRKLKALVLSNGPTDKADMFTRTFSKLPIILRKLIMKPPWFFRFLKSSAGLRRLVVNPYVMDHDTVVTVCSTLDSGGGELQNYARYLGVFSDNLPPKKSLAEAHILIWGDSDVLYPNSEADLLSSILKNARHIEIPGGKHLHPIERPWAMADAIDSSIESRP